VSHSTLVERATFYLAVHIFELTTHNSDVWRRLLQSHLSNCMGLSSSHVREALCALQQVTVWQNVRCRPAAFNPDSSHVC
jgi:hypothetical protein